MEECSPIVYDLSDLSYRFDRADLAICIHDRDQDCLVGDLILQRLNVNDPILVNRKVGDLETLLAQVLAYVEY